MNARNSLVIRSGGLGDFILTLPLIDSLRAVGPVVLVTRPSYAALVAEDDLYDSWLSVDGPEMLALDAGTKPFALGDRRAWSVYSFLRLSAAGRHGWASYRELASRPVLPPHVARRMFIDAGIREPSDLLQTAVLQRAQEPQRPCLWLHPGSGSAAKNAPLDEYRRRAASWRAEHPQGDIVVSIGEADMALLDEARRTFAEVGALIRVQPTLPELRQELAARATAFVSNDTGVSHLAAALGIPTTAIFRATSPDLWRPLGPQVDCPRWPAPR